MSTGRQTDRQTDRQTYIHTDRQTDRQTDKQTGRQTGNSPLGGQGHQKKKATHNLHADWLESGGQTGSIRQHDTGDLLTPLGREGGFWDQGINNTSQSN